MTTGVFNLGSSSTLGPYTRKNWNGSDSTPPTYLPRMKFRDLPPIGDIYGNVYDPKEDGFLYKAELIRAKGRWLKSHKTGQPDKPFTWSTLNPYTKSHMKAMNTPVYREDTGLYAGPFMSTLGDFTVADTWSNNDLLKLYDKLREKVLGSDLHVGVALAEIDLAMVMLRDTFKALTRTTERALRKDWRGALQEAMEGPAFRQAGQGNRRRSKEGAREHWSNGMTSEAASIHLLWHYGYEPLIKDVDATMAFVAWRTSGVPISRVVATRRIQLKATPDLPALLSDGDYTYAYSSARIVAYLKTVDIVGLLGVYDLPSAVYERIPYSFILDWAVPVQQYLSALNTKRSMTGEFVITRKLEAQFKPAGTKVVAPDGKTYVHDGAYWSRRFWIWRTVSSDLNIPFPGVKPFAKIASASHTLSAASLLVQTLSNGRAKWL